MGRYELIAAVSFNEEERGFHGDLTTTPITILAYRHRRTGKIRTERIPGTWTLDTLAGDR